LTASAAPGRETNVVRSADAVRVADGVPARSAYGTVTAVRERAVQFRLRGEVGAVLARVAPNTDPLAIGCGLLDSAVPGTAASGYPVCRAEVQFRPRGYSAAMGWIQLVRSTDGQLPERYELDPLSLFRHADTPYAFFGIRPELFDAPFRGRRASMMWRARSFLCASPDAVMSRIALPLCAFAWGFSIEEDGSTPSITGPEALSKWAEHVRLLETAHPAWRFRKEPSDVL
jgi:hypothetical protein